MADIHKSAILNRGSINSTFSEHCIGYAIRDKLGKLRLDRFDRHTVEHTAFVTNLKILQILRQMFPHHTLC
ncbi:hypothetical protein SDC9_204769 [bioreactor metagenome]|uniref:Uncharacterized protein n=1 Tax=bioreactor metagenome TaxID=1076179 RepID=A0A645J053_9ZZZZ